MESEVKVGVFVCRCGINIASIINVPEVVEYAKTLPNVAYAEENLYTCSSEGMSRIKDAIKRHGLNRVVVASCTPRTHEPLFQAACEEAGLNPYLFEMANIRDQCSWVHMHEPEAATEKAKGLVRMAVAKARMLEPGEEPEIEVKPTALVIGGGVSGLVSALSLSHQGFRVHLVEKQAELGGMLLRLNKLFPHEKESEEILVPLIDSVKSSPNIKVHISSTVRAVRGFMGNFDVEVESLGMVETISVGTIIVAIGADSLEPVGLYGYGGNKRIVTQMQLEEMIKHGGLEKVREIVMIQCAGSRSDERPYCSRICCNEAVKNSILLMKEDPQREIYILYRDLQTYGIHYSSIEWEAKEQGIKLIKYLADKPPQVSSDNDRVTVRVFAPLLNEDIEIEPDLVVLSTPMIPAADARTISQLLKVPLDSTGFFMEAHVKLRPIDFATDGIYVCGTAHGPKDVGESISQALGAASRAGIPMAKGRIRAPAITSKVDENKCIGCGICIELCPYNAIRKNEIGVAQVTSAVCKGCGICGASCPERAITMIHFTNEQLLAQGLAALGRDVE